jgi:hypothetical protein
MLSISIDFKPPWHFPKTGLSGQMTMPARRASKFPAKKMLPCSKPFFKD